MKNIWTLIKNKFKKGPTMTDNNSSDNCKFQIGSTISNTLQNSSSDNNNISQDSTIINSGIGGIEIGNSGNILISGDLSGNYNFNNLAMASSNIYPTTITGTSSTVSWMPTGTISIGTSSWGGYNEEKKTIYSEIEELLTIKSKLNLTKLAIAAAEEKFTLINKKVTKVSWRYSTDEKAEKKKLEIRDETTKNLKQLKQAAKELLKMCNEMQTLINEENMEEVMK